MQPIGRTLIDSPEMELWAKALARAEVLAEHF
jgi:hypothetical protein